MLEDYNTSPVVSSSALSPAAFAAALAFAEAILPGSDTVPAADEVTVTRTEEVLREAGDSAVKAWSALVVGLDHTARFTTGKPFHALSRRQQDDVLRSWESSPILRGPLNGLAMTLKMAHFDLRRSYVALGGELRVLNAPPLPRWESQIKSASDWEEDRDVECDVVVVGTGVGGSVVGRALADRGLAVVFVEEGKRRKRNDYKGSFVHAHTSYFRNVLAVGPSPVIVLMGKLVGGSSAVNGGTCLRPPQHIHQEWCERFGTDDLSFDRMAPYLAGAEAMLGVAEPERRYIGPIADIFDRGANSLGWRVAPVPRNATGCEGQGFCDFGCSTGARRSVDLSYLPGALERGALVLSDLRADTVTIEGGRAVGIEAYDVHQRRFRVRAKAVVVAGGAIPTPLMLLKQGIANSSGEIGKNLSLHPSVGVGAEFDDLLEPQKYIPQGYMLTEFLRDGILVLAAQPDANIAPMMYPHTGPRLMRAMDAFPHHALFGALIRDDTRGRVWRNVRGVPAVSYNIKRSDVDRMQQAINRTAELCWAAGAKRVFSGVIGLDPLENRADFEQFKRRSLDPAQLALVGYHPLGTCRMGQDPRTSVVGLDHQTHDVPGLFIVDGSTVPGPTGVNPQLLIMAMATRAAEGIAAKL